LLGEPVASQPAPPAVGIGDAVAAFMANRRKQQAEAEAEQARRQALFGALPNPFG